VIGLRLAIIAVGANVTDGNSLVVRQRFEKLLAASSFTVSRVVHFPGLCLLVYPGSIHQLTASPAASPIG
jgi:hypothetical protein